MFLIKHGDDYIASNALAGVLMYGYDIRLSVIDRGYVIIKSLSDYDTRKYITDYVVEAIAEMAAKDAIRALVPPPQKNPWMYTVISVPVPTAEDMILDIDEVVEAAEEEYVASRSA